MNVLLINGSPHKNGCTYTALSEVAKTLSECNVESEIVHIGSQPVRGCIGCGKCKDSHLCVYDDVVNEIIRKAEKADGFVIGTPVYYASANGSLVSLLDRLFSAGNAFAFKPAAAVATARRAGTTSALEVINKYFTIRQMPVVSSSYWNMVHGNTPDEVKQDLEGLQIMRNLGRNMAWLLHCIEAGKQKGIQLPKNEYSNKTSFIR